MSTILLEGGIALIHDSNENVNAVKTNILIQDNKIKKIAPDITPPAGADIVNCTDKIVSPGFISTHSHLWQTPLKARHADETLLDYMSTGFPHAFHLDAKNDLFWNQLAGALEYINSGTTTVLDHAHMNYHPDNTRYALSATVASGLRSVFGYGLHLRAQSFNPFQTEPSMIEPWMLELLEELATNSPYGGPHGRVELGVSCDVYSAGADVVKPLMEKIRQLNIRTLTAHGGRTTQTWESSSCIAAIHAAGMLTPGMVLSHANMLDANDCALLEATGAWISSTPSTEYGMGMSRPVALDARLPTAISARASLGTDTHAYCPADIINEMRLLLLGQRALQHEALVLANLAPARVPYTVADAFNTATLAGARALQRGEELGSLAEGKLADLVMFDALSPALCSAAQNDPLAAIVMHASPADVVDVLIDGVWRKQDGRLLHVTAEEGDARAREMLGVEGLTWREIAARVVASQKRFAAAIDVVDMKDVREKMNRIFCEDPSRLIDPREFHA